MLRIVLLCTLFFFSTAHAAPPKLIGKHKNWLHQTCVEGKKTVHYILSQPTSSKGKYKKSNRGAVYLLVTREGKKDVVSFVAGYKFKPGSKVTLRFNKGKQFTLFTDDDRAWAENESTDKAIVDLLKKRSSLTVTATSSRGTKTVDKFSLAGSTAAYKALK